MNEKLYHYKGKDIEVSYDVNRCIHAAECVRGLHDVFDPERKPWVDADAASSDDIAQTIETCPTGALQYKKSDGQSEATSAANAIKIQPDGPIYIRGDIEILSSEGELLRKETRVALCRCGESANKPFCDGAHSKAGFTDGAMIGTHKLQASENPSGTLRIKLATNAPLLLEGPFTLESMAGGEAVDGAKCALCRCGASSNKPFCDGTHRNIEFDTQGF